MSAGSSAAAPAQAQKFEIVPRHKGGRQWLARADAYSVGLAFVNGEIDVYGDFISAVRYQLSQSATTVRRQFLDAVCRWSPWRLTQRWTSRGATARNIRFHYDRSNEFYKLFLDSHMVYSCAYFERPGTTLDQAQAAKLDHICRKLALHPGERFLDIGCGWGALVRYAASSFGVHADGCTISDRQFEYATERIQKEGLAEQATIREMDYRDLAGTFDKISSVGMFEHVGRAHLEEYFRAVSKLLAPNGLFLNHGITRPAPVRSDAQSLFIARAVFPGGQIVTLHDVIHAAENAGFEVLDVENLRRHYALTCRAWVDRLMAQRDACLEVVDQATWRTWQLYLAGSSIAFDEGGLGLHQVLLAKRGVNDAAPMTRAHVYRG
ncbi:MAG TPA: cyclopropane-fatty-acyl-phospholipid synthase family protein [Bryobacteraceae bacterium]|nr:cyclopropane-fatty-acyl-phospholipid synthase family protein [Bryobacteraceae bacterium]